MNRSTQRLYPFDTACATRPWRLFALIATRIYAEILLLSLAGLVCMALLLAVAAYLITSSRPIPDGIQTGLWLVGLLPLVIAIEEFYHAASCLGRGKPDRLNGLVIGRYYIDKVYAFFGYAAVDIRGRINLLDKLYISAAGPILASLSIFIVWMICRITELTGPLRTALLILSAVPFVGLIPNRAVIQSDGYAVAEAFRRLGVPWAAKPVELIRAVSFPLRWLLQPRRTWPDEFLSLAETYQAIERALAKGDPHSAIAYYRRLIRVDPYNSINHNNLAWLLADTRQYSEAHRHARKARILAPTDPDVLDTLARLRREWPKRVRSARAVFR